MAIDYTALFGAEEYDPCAALVALRPALMKIMVDGRVATVKFRDRTVEFHRQDTKELEALVQRLESECAAKRGRRSSRRAITAGARRA
ncbi:gpW family head-tail joining protein [Hoeflea sp.]|uniref:gpW family head-tail joining protein n=1 Tax=Hoeflea sp. TaxID=1940281 RepID=UPI003B524D47